jgi:sigma-B regulation protein RsbU (phosphoserine phosphatase)
VLRVVVQQLGAGFGAYQPDGTPLFEIEVPVAARRDPLARQVHPIMVDERMVGTVVGYANLKDRSSDSTIAAVAHSVAACLGDVVQREMELEEMTAELVARLEEVALLSHLSETMNSLLDEISICEIGLEAALDALSAIRGFVAIEPTGSSDLAVVTHRGFEQFDTTVIQRGSGVSGYAAQWGNLVNLYQEESWGDAMASPQREAVLAVPFSRFHTSGERRSFGVLTLIGHRSGGRFGASDENLATTIAGYLGSSIHNCRLVRSAQNAARVERELELAAEIQQSLLPDAPPAIEGYDLAARCVAAATVGGDCYDYFSVDSNRLALLIADVAGHSIGSAMMMGHARNALRWGLKQGAQPSDALRTANSMTSADVSAAGLFITVQACTVEPTSGALNLASGGHNPAVIARADGTVEWLDPEGFPFGFVDEAEYSVEHRMLAPGDLLVLYTDGVVEARDPDGAFFGDDAFAQLLHRLRGQPADAVICGIYDALDDFSHGAPQLDDITVVVLYRRTEVAA